MRKILSVVLAVVMLASLAAVMPVSAATTAPGLVITEICVDTTAGERSLGGGDLFEFVELYNSTDKAINLYDYAITLNSSLSVGTAPDSATFTDFTPILSPEMSKAAGNTVGSIATSKQAQDNMTPETSVWPYYPTNPATAVLEPGKTAVVWMYTFDTYAFSHTKANLGFQDFKDYWHIGASDDTIIVAIDANGSNSTNGTVYDEYGTKIIDAKFKFKGSDGAANDLMADVYPSSDGRFNGANSGSRYYGVAKLADIANARTTLTHGQIESYVYVNYNDADPTKNLMYKYSGGQGTGSNPDATYNFTYTAAASEYAIGKVAGKVEFGDWLNCQYGTPGKLLPKQVADFAVLGSNAAASAIGHDKDATITTLVNNHLLYSENFENNDAANAYRANYGSADLTGKTDSALRDALGWKSDTTKLSGPTAANIFAVKLAISGGKLVCTNDTKYDNIIQVVAPALMAGLKDTDVNSADYNKKLAYANLLLEYDIKYGDVGTNRKSDRYAGVVYNYNGNITYGIFILRVQGIANNQSRYGGQYVTYDVSSEYYAANNDTVAGQASVISKLTKGRISASSTASNIESMRLANLDQDLHVKIYIDQTYGPSIYVNDILISVPVNNALWGISREYGDLGLGLFVSQYVKCEIDNIKLWALSTDNDYYDVYKNLGIGKDAYVDSLAQKGAQYEIQNPSTGDVTMYVAIAMAVSFISLAALVVVKRKKSVND